MTFRLRLLPIRSEQSAAAALRQTTDTKMLLGLSVVVAVAAASRSTSSVTRVKSPASLNLISATGVLSWNGI
jgi:hypothetical protein